MDDARETLRSESINRRRTIKPVRMPQVSPIGLISLLYALSLFVFYRQGFISGGSFVLIAMVVVASVAGFHLLFRFGHHTRYRDPSLMLPQLVVSLAIMLTVAWLERPTQIALVPFMLIAFSFGIFRLTTLSLIMLSAVCLSAYLAIILLRGQAEGHDFVFRADLVQWCVLALTLPGMILVGKQIQNMRQLLRATRYQLEHYEEKSVRDELTGLYNRRQLQTELEQARLHAQTRAVPFCICLIDIDRFKQINDNCGHLAGDTIIREFAKTARDCIRDTDVLGRYGGDEFLQILPDTDLKGAVMHAERLRVYAHFLDFQKVLPQKHISLSIGVAEYRPGEKITDLIARADAALYRAKQLGRNRVEWSTEQVAAPECSQQ
ncbi:GGDEF domain-containing protein [Noviherbaspirillum aridicola]|uniref:diguanylate cyclase n=1 Tax=Noviherbaspirillum aridicola TaxID=2849687 RepID=A0ABQ4Q200_9BURK|nr:GGDEF domain-containing protein [Noviherbaspirillum aridicola]GIZ50870.1 GGDEF domain-containing protein [Noviherbaspirillum aridicola]